MTMISKECGKYTLYDEGIGVEIMVKQLYSRHYEASAHLTIWATAPDGVKRKLYGARTPITTDTARERISNKIERLIRGDDKKGDEGMK